MKIKKNIICDIDILSAKEMYTSDLTALLFEKVKKKFQLKCYRGFFISKVIRIINHSAIVIKNNTVDATGSVSVNFEVEGIQYVKKELIPNVIVTNAASNLMGNSLHFSNDYVRGILQMKQESNRAFLDVIPEKSQIPVIVTEAAYNPCFDSVAVIAAPFTPQEFADNPIIFVCDSKNSDNMEKQAVILADFELLKAELELHQKMKKEENYKFFSDLIYPYKPNLVSTSIFPETKMSELTDLLKLSTVSIIYSMFDYHNLDNFDKFTIQSLTENKKSQQSQNDKYTVIFQDLDTTLKLIIVKRLLYLKALRELVETFDLDKTTKLKQYWKLYQSKKITLA